MVIGPRCKSVLANLLHIVRGHVVTRGTQQLEQLLHAPRQCLARLLRHRIEQLCLLEQRNEVGAIDDDASGRLDRLPRGRGLAFGALRRSWAIYFVDAISATALLISSSLHPSALSRAIRP